MAKIDRVWPFGGGAKFNSCAFQFRDVRESRRGRPSSDLHDFARQRGVNHLGDRAPAAFAPYVPGVEGQQFNVLHGGLPGGADGILLHERLRVPALMGKPPQGNAWWAVRYSSTRTRPDVGDVLDPFDLGGSVVETLDPTDLLMTDLSDVLGGGRSEPHDDWFLVPCTVALTLEPKARLLPRLRMDRHWRVPPLGFEHRRECKPQGLDGWHVQSSPVALGDELLQSICAGPIGDLLRARTKGFFQIVIADGAIAVRANGFLSDPGELDALAEALGAAAAHVRALAVARSPV
jgi:hypothetical protein